MNLNRKLGEMDYDGLISDPTPPVQKRSGTIDRLATAATLKRGTIMVKGSASKKLFVLGDTETYEKHASFTGNGSTVAFTITDKPAAEDIVGVTIDSATKVVTTDYSYVAGTGVMTFVSAPADGKAIIVTYKLTDLGTVDCILCDDTEVGTSGDVPVTVYTAGCFDPDKVTVASGHTITDAEYKQMREYGIVFKAALDAN
ncbi:MAG: hypothetical protein RSD95_02810 [Clostridia bacterium]